MCINLTDYIAKGPIKESIIQLLLAMHQWEVIEEYGLVATRVGQSDQAGLRSHGDVAGSP